MSWLLFILVRILFLYCSWIFLSFIRNCVLNFRFFNILSFMSLLSFWYIFVYLYILFSFLSLGVCDHLLWLFHGMCENVQVYVYLSMVYRCSQLFSLIFVIYLVQYEFVLMLLIFSPCIWNMCLLLISRDLCINLWGVAQFGFFFRRRNSLNIFLSRFFSLFLHWSRQLLELLKIYCLFDLVSCLDHCRNLWWFLDYYWWFRNVEHIH